MMASALFGLPGSHESLHGLENLVHTSHVSIHEMFVMHLKEPMILFVLFQTPVPPIHVSVLV